MRFGSLQTEARILDLPVAATLLTGWILTALAGALYSRIFGRVANNVRNGWLFGMAFGFVVWAAGAVLLLPLASGGRAPAGSPALGLFLSLVVWGGTPASAVALRASAVAQVAAIRGQKAFERTEREAPARACRPAERQE